MDFLQTVEAYIIIIGSILAGVVYIFNQFGKPLSFFKKKKEEKQKKEVEQIVAQIKTSFTPQFEELVKNNESQNKKIDLLIASSCDILRARIVEIYDRYKDYKKITERDREVLDLLFIDYKSENGNGAIERLYNRTKEWEVVSDDTIFD